MSLKRSSTTQPGNMTFSRGGPDEQQAEAVHHQQGGRNPAQAEAVRRLLDGRQADGGRHFQEDERRPINSPRTDVVFPWTVLNHKHELNESQLIKHESNESDINYNELKQFAVCWTGDWPETHFTINLGCALGKVQRAGTGLTQTVPPQAPMRGLSALNGDLKDLRSQARAPDELPH